MFVCFYMYNNNNYLFITHASLLCVTAVFLLVLTGTSIPLCLSVTLTKVDSFENETRTRQKETLLAASNFPPCPGCSLNQLGANYHLICFVLLISLYRELGFIFS